jgi:hypothetical protein
MTQKKFDLAKNLALKINNQMKAGGVPGRFGQEAAVPVDKREQRRRDAAAGLVPIACKLPSELAQQLNERAALHEGGMTGLLVEVLGKALKKK